MTNQTHPATRTPTPTTTNLEMMWPRWTVVALSCWPKKWRCTATGVTSSRITRAEATNNTR